MARDIYPTVSVETAAQLIEGFKLRLGTYGDPGMVPALVWAQLVATASDHTGYTHRAHDTGSDLIGMVMASADSLAEAEAFQAAGWGTFRVSTDPNEPRIKGEARCPASAEAGKRVTCETCPLKCNGAVSDGVRGRVILDHGPGGIGRAIARGTASV